MERGAEAVERVIALERSLLLPEVRGSRERIDALLHEDFREIGASGRVWSRHDLIETLLAAGPLEALHADEFQGSELSPGIVLIAWRSTTGTRSVRRSSLWRHEGTGWRILFHQGTRVPGDSTAPGHLEAGTAEVPGEGG